MTKVAWPALIISLAFLLSRPLRHRLGGGVVDTGIVSRLVVGIVVSSGRFLLDLSLMQLLVQLGDWVRYPVGPSRRIANCVVVSPFDLSISRYSASTFMMLLDDVCNELRVFIAQYWTSVDSLFRLARDGRRSLDASGGSECRSEVRLLALDLDTRSLVLKKSREGSPEALGLVIQVRFGREDTVARLELECQGKLHPSGVLVELAILDSPSKSNISPSLRVDPLRKRMPKRSWYACLLVLCHSVLSDNGCELGPVSLFRVYTVVTFYLESVVLAGWIDLPRVLREPLVEQDFGVGILLRFMDGVVSERRLILAVIVGFDFNG